MPLIQNIDGARAAAGPALEAALTRSAAALDWLREQHAQNGLALLRYPEKTDDLAAIKAAAQKIAAGATDIVVLGTGGSSLGGQTLAQLAGYGVEGSAAFTKPRLHFMGNLDPVSFDALLSNLPLKTSRFIAVSKSGGTGETLMQTIAALSALTAGGVAAKDVMLGISEPALKTANGLRDLLKPFDVPFMEHDTGVGGRYSVLTNVGLVAAAAAGLDVGAVRRGATDALAPVLHKQTPDKVPAAVGAALGVALAEKGRTVSVVMAYADRLERFTRWYVQLWAESLGKGGKGTTPLAALGPVDQHSQLQLFKDGPADKFFTVITTETARRGAALDATLTKSAGEAGFGGKTMGDLVAAQGRATAETLTKSGHPVRTIHLPKLDEAALGELLMHFMLETIIAARLLGVDAFDQPAVEEGKVLAKKYLAGG